MVSRVVVASTFIWATGTCQDVAVPSGPKPRRSSAVLGGLPDQGADGGSIPQIVPFSHSTISDGGRRHRVSSTYRHRHPAGRLRGLRRTPYHYPTPDLPTALEDVTTGLPS